MPAFCLENPHYAGHNSGFPASLRQKTPVFLGVYYLILGTLGIYSMEDSSSVIPINEIEISEFENLSVSTSQQVDHLLYVGLGDFQKENEASGLANLDITDPEKSTIGIYTKL